MKQSITQQGRATKSHVIKNYAEITVNGAAVLALVDTGATISCVSESFLTKGGIKAIPKYDPTMVVGFNGSKTAVLGSTEIEIEIGQVPVKQKFYVVEHLHNPCILGMDFLKTHNGKIDIENSTVTFLNGRVKLPLQPDPKVALFRTSQSVTIPANCEQE